MENVNNTILAEMQEYAQLYFAAILDVNTDADGKCSLKAGKYTAKEMIDNSHKSVFGHSYALPVDPIFDEQIIIGVGAFRCEFNYRDIFAILDRFEKAIKAAKQKAVFEIGEVEVISAKVMTNEKTELGAYKEKRMKLQRLHGNWYAPARIKKNAYNVEIYYKHNKLIFYGGDMAYDMIEDKNRENLIKRLDKTENELTSALLRLAERNEYFAEVCKRMNIEAQQPATPAETPQISTESTEAVSVSAEGEEREISRLIALYGFRFSTAPDNSNLWRLYSNSEPITDYMTIRQLLEWLRSYSHKQDTSNRPQPPKFAPQSRKTAQAVNYVTPMPKARKNARKRHYRRLGANGYAMLDDAAATLAAINAPRHITANSPPIGRPHRTFYW